MSTIFTLGIDPGIACTAWALAQNEPKPLIIDAGTIKLGHPDKLERAIGIASAVARIYDDRAPQYAWLNVVIERAPAMYSTRPRGAADSDLNFLIGAIAYAIENLEAFQVAGSSTSLSYVYPATWRTQVMGAANIQPDKATICELFSVADPKRMLANPDLRDACCIAGWGARR